MSIDNEIHIGFTYGADNDSDVYDGDRALGFIVMGEYSTWLFCQMHCPLVDNKDGRDVETCSGD